jgi:hypothetical protein
MGLPLVPFSGLETNHTAISVSIVQSEKLYYRIGGVDRAGEGGEGAGAGTGGGWVTQALKHPALVGQPDTVLWDALEDSSLGKAGGFCLRFTKHTETR